MISVQMSGRLGNQMFIYAYALSASKRLRCSFFISHELTDAQSFVLPDFFVCNRFKPRWNRFLFRLFRKFKITLETIDIDSSCPPLLEIKKEKNWRNYRGFMQSEQYFSDFEKLIRSELTLRKDKFEKFHSKYGSIFSSCKTLVIHRRKGDYKDFGSDELGYDLTLPIEFYERALAQVKDLDRYQVFVIGDDTSDLQAHFGNRQGFHYVSNEMIVDFQLIQNADVAIISNSSFAWWAAYLNPKAEKVVYAPKYWLGFKIKRDFPKSIESVPWKWMEF